MNRQRKTCAYVQNTSLSVKLFDKDQENGQHDNTKHPHPSTMALLQSFIKKQLAINGEFKARL